MSPVASPHKLLFFDWRHLRCGHLQWLTPDGVTYGVSRPPEPQVEMHATLCCVPHGVRLQAQAATKTEPVDGWKGWGRVIYDGGVYRTWYLEIDGNPMLGSGSTAQEPNPRQIALCAAESPDGFVWTERHRCLLELPGQHGFDGCTFMIDPIAPAAERYRFIYTAWPPEETGERMAAEYLKRPARYRDERIVGGVRACLFMATSPDGLEWTPDPEPLMMHPSDTDTTVTYDAALGKYVLYTRMFREERRWIGRAESDDLRDWPGIEPLIWPRLDDPPDYDFYLNGYSAYPGLPQYHVMFPMVWHRMTERSEVRLYSSADGIAWNQTPGGPVLTPGRPNDWDGDFIGGGKDLVPFGNARIAIPYTGTSYPHKYPRWPAVWEAWRMAWAWWPRDRLCALVADRVGEFCTMPQRPAGKTLRLNMRVPRGGEIKVGIIGVSGRGVEDCDPLHGDDAARVVTWGGDARLNVPADQPVSLHVRMRCAELFAVEWCA